MNKNYFSILTGILLILSFTLMSSMNITKADDIPEEVEKILENSCYGCHTTGAKAEKAVNALDFKKWDKLKPTKKVGALNDIKEVLDEGAMPPEKFLNRYPDKAPSEKDKETILNWVKQETAKLME